MRPPAVATSTPAVAENSTSTPAVAENSASAPAVAENSVIEYYSSAGERMGVLSRTAASDDDLSQFSARVLWWIITTLSARD